MCVFTVPECMCVHYMQPGGRGGQRRVLTPLDLELQAVVSSLVWALGTELGSSERQQALLVAEPSLQLHA